MPLKPKKELNLRDSCKVNIFLMKIFFLWHENKRIAKSCYQFISTVLAVLSVAQIFYLVHEDNFEEFVRCASVAFTLANGSFKYIYFNLDKTLDLLKYFDLEIFQPSNDKQVKICKKSIWMSQGLTTIYFLMSSTPCTMVPVTGYIEGKLAAPMWLPYLTDIYWFAFPLTSVYTVITGFTSCLLDCIVAVLMIQIGAQCDLLNDKLENLLTKNLDPEESYDDLKMCITHHKLIVKLADEFVEVFHNIIFAQFAMSIPVYCQTMYLLNTLPMGLGLITEITYAVCILFEPLVLCWFGNEVIIKSDKFAFSAYSCQWYNASPKFKKAFVYFIHRSQKPIVMYIGKLFTASIGVWVTIVKSSWSYYLMLMRVNSREQH